MKSDETKSNNQVEVLPEIQLPVLHFDIVEQFALALQNRDKNALEYIISDTMASEDFKDKHTFISNFISYCNTLEKKHEEIYVQTNKGACSNPVCNKGMTGISVSVNTLKNNKQLWTFNIIPEIDSNGKLDMFKCKFLKLDKAEV